MSVRVMSKAWDADLPATDKLVLLALADWSDDGGRCWPSIAQLRAKCGLSERAVQGAIQRLKKGGHLDRDENTGRGVNYTVHPRSKCTPANYAPPQQMRETPAANAPNTSGTVIPKKGKPSLERAHRLAPDWQPENLTPGTVAFEIVQAWEPGRIERELSKFRDHWAAASGRTARKHDWQAAWRTWIGNADEWGRQANRAGGNGSGGRMGGPRPDPTLALVRSAIAAQQNR